MQIYMVWQCLWRDFEWKIGMEIGLEQEKTGKEVQDVEQIDRDVRHGVWDEHCMVQDGLGGLVVVDLHGLVVLVAGVILSGFVR